MRAKCPPLDFLFLPPGTGHPWPMGDLYCCFHCFYTVEFGKTRLSDVVRAAGGFTEDASLSEAFIVRRMYEKIIDPEFERLSEMNVESMSKVEREYYKIRSRERKGNVAVDFVALFVHGDSTQDILLRDDDYIEIPMKSNIVTVIGQVRKPGAIAFKQDQNVPVGLA